MSLKMREILAEAEEELFQAGIEEAGNDAWLLFEAVFETDRAHYFLIMNEQISDIENGTKLYEKYKNIISLRCQRIPLQYITGHQVFMGIDFLVNENVLIPRQDTEILAEQTLKVCEGFSMKKNDTEALHILDMCTGSGCIAVSLKKLSKIPLYVTAVDLSEKALMTAKENAIRNCCEIEFIQGDLFENLNGRKFDIIVSNPPYIKSADISGLMEEVRDYEPLMALDGAEDGLKFYRRITENAKNFLNSEGHILYEIGCWQAEDVAGILKEHGFVNIQIFRDLAGLNRVAAAQYCNEKQAD